jgi:toxin HigB-1
LIRSFKRRETQLLYEGKRSKRFQPIESVARRRLRMLDSALGLGDLASVPGNNLEPLKGDRAGQYSIRVNAQYRVCFQWNGQDALEVEIVDYH